MEVTNRRRNLNWSLLRMVFTLVFGDDLRFACSVQHKGVGWTTAVDMFLLVYDVKIEEHAFFDERTLDK